MEISSFTCPHCEIEQRDVWVRMAHSLSDPNDGWYEHFCPGCGRTLHDDLVEAVGGLAS